MPRTHTKCIGILTSGGDCPGLNAAIRAVVKPALTAGIKVVGIHDGFRGLVENRTVLLEDPMVSGILAMGGTILGTSRDKPKKMSIGGKILDMTEAAIHNYHQLHLDCLVCLGGGGTAKNALHLHKIGQKTGVKVMTLPKTIDNDVAETDVTFGFDTAMEIATEAIDRLHTTATSHHRIIICEIMGHNAGWLPLGAGMASGADVILLPEIPYDLNVVAEHLLERRRHGKRFSIIAVAEGAMDIQEAATRAQAQKKAAKHKKGKKDKRSEKNDEGNDIMEITGDSQSPHLVQEPKASRLARALQQLTGTEARVTSLGHVQRGGTPSGTDRVLCTRLGVSAMDHLMRGVYNVMIAVKGDDCLPVPLGLVAGKRKIVPLDHPWIHAARRVGTCFGDRIH